MNPLVSTQVQQTGKPVVVLGLGGTGLSCARFLYRQQIPFVVMDSRDLPPGLDELRSACPGVDVHLGGFDTDLLAQARRLIVSPGISLQEPPIAAAMAGGVPVAGDIDLFCEQAQAPVIGITGSNGKSTVTDLLGHMARRAAKKVGVGGNLGLPALDLLANEVDFYVLELSSFQLERAGELGLAVATVLNLSDDHLDRHGHRHAYRAAKHRLFVGAQHIVINRDDEMTVPQEAPESARITSSFGLQEPVEGQFGLRLEAGEEWLACGEQLLIPVAGLALVGRHNAVNALAGLALGTEMGLPMPAMLETLRAYTGLAHRCELVGSHSGVRFINDSKATNVGATVAALGGLATANNIVLIAGGQGKGADFDALREPVLTTCKAVFLLGEDAPAMQRALGAGVKTVLLDELEQAVGQAWLLAEKGDVVLLSPACASFDMFDSFAHRGEHFIHCVQALISGVQPS